MPTPVPTAHTRQEKLQEPKSVGKLTYDVEVRFSDDFTKYIPVTWLQFSLFSAGSMFAGFGLGLLLSSILN